jgi:hypothetical protein
LKGNTPTSDPKDDEYDGTGCVSVYDEYYKSKHKIATFL